MATRRPIRLKEDPRAAPPGAHVIDAEFAIVTPPRRKGLLHRIGRSLANAALAGLVAALIGLIIPPAVALANLWFNNAG